MMETRWRATRATEQRDALMSRDCLLRCGAVSGAVVETGHGLLYAIEGKPERLSALRTVIGGSRAERLSRVLLEDVGPPMGFRKSWPRTPRLLPAERAWLELLLDGDPPTGAVIALIQWAAARASEFLTDFALGPTEADAFPPSRLN